MNEFYSKLAIAGSSLLIGSIITILIARITKKSLSRLTSKTKNKTDDYILKTLVDTIRPLGIIISASFSWRALDLEGDFNQSFLALTKLACIILIVRLANRVFLKLLLSWGTKINDPAVATMLKSLSPMIRAVIWSVGVVFYLQNMGVQMAALWAILSAGGIGAGLALKEPVQEFFEYITILLDKPFQNGQFIHINGIWAKVERVGVRSTRLRSINGEIIVMSNSNLTNGIISNYAEMENRRLVHRLGVEYNTSHSKMKKIPGIIKSIVDQTDNAIFDRCHFIEFGNSSLDFELVYYIPTNDYLLAMKAQEEINLDIMKSFEAESISFAFPTQTINLTKSTKSI
ncbi:mechanosensitive ion channel family protein [Prochlorococcus marinus]|uniref:Small mechanosensitive ion channel, MscS family n=1 Tax=Prochlorococcus marinus (strain MIT 9211) TaxID=93059 RepID=A9BA12_PROM4|nr:mechanosensitive ion channel family protein [Prochlorococcus marinus]ABX08674.1 small mechanosensitive ion channel, MscS family [Prochlorococcus marinus str. MIT 9211]